MDKELIQQDFDNSLGKYPTLKIYKSSLPQFAFVINGYFDVVDADDYHWGTFEASIYFHHTYPKGFPSLVDKSELFPWHIDWHINPINGECCVCSPLESIENGDRGITIVEYIDHYVIPFYANQIYRREYGEYKNGEYSHFEEGVWETLAEEINISDKDMLKKLINGLPLKYRRNDPCFCGSGKKAKKCHGPRIKYIKELLSKFRH